MKQSTKLLSLVLALIMAFSCMTVIGNAMLVQSETDYDSIDDAALSPEQVADLALDLVDDLLTDADLGTIDIVILSLDLTSINGILQSLVDINGNFLWSLLKGLAKNVGALDFSALEKSSGTAWQRTDGDIKVVKALLSFLGNNTNSEIVSRIVYGFGSGGTNNSNGDITNTAQLDLGIISNFINLGSIEELLADIPGMLTELVYDLIIFGSYNAAYENESYPSVEDLGEDPVLPTDVDTLDEMIDLALLNLLTNPQEYDWVGEGKDAVKDWDEGSIILPSLKADRESHSAYLMSAEGGSLSAEAAQAACADFVTPLSNSLFGLLDFVAQYAIDDIGINALNNNLKKALMEAVEIDLNEINASDLPAAVYTDFEVDKNDGEESYVTYIAYDRMAENSGDYYYTTMETVTEKDANGDPVLDEEGNEKTYKERKYYKANMLSGNEFASLINWDWKFTDSKTAADASKGETQLLYSNIIKDYDGDGTASIVEGINDLLKLVYDVALTDEVKADFEATVGTGYVGGSNANLMTNVNNIAKYILANYGELVFGSTSPYAHLDYETDLKALDTVDLIAMIGPSFFEDVMPQIIMPKNADGTYAFHDGVQIYEFGALVLREFVSDITPNVNYDQYIFANGDVTSENDRQFKVQGVNQWFNLILNMGVDIGYTYLYNITNFGDVFTYDADGNFASKTFRSTNGTIPSLPELNGTNVYDDTRWTAMLDEAIIWGARYVGGYTGTSVIEGLDVTSISNVSGPLNKLSYVLNKILPLGFVNGYSTTASNGVKYEFNVESFVNDGLKGFFTDFDLARVLGLLGRNTASEYNMLDDNNLINAVLNLVNDILGLIFRDDNTSDAYTGLLQCNAKTVGGTQSVDSVISKASLKKTVALLLRRLNASGTPILINALPVVGKLIKGWGTEQSFDVPEIGLDTTMIVDAEGNTRTVQYDEDCDGNKTYTGYVDNPFTIEVKNTADGVWRRYLDPDTRAEKFDNQYKIEVISVKAYNFNGTTSSYVEQPTITKATANYGESATFTFNVGYETAPSGSVSSNGQGLSNVPATGAVARFDVEYKVYGEDGNAYLDGQTFTERMFVNFALASDEGSTEQYRVESEDHHIAVVTPQYVPYSDAVNYVENVDVIRVWRAASGNKYTYTASPSGTNPVHGFKMGSFSNEMKVMEYDSKIKLFATYTAALPYSPSTLSGVFGSDGGTDEVQINGTVPTQEEFESYVDYETVQAQGASASWNVSLSTSKDSGSGVFTLKYYDDIYRDKLIDLVDDENNEMRLAANYYTDSTVIYADRLLESEDKVDDNDTPDDTSDDEVILRETDSTATAWVDSYGTVVAASAVTEDEEDTSKGTYVKDGDTISVKKVTTFVASEVWAKYLAAIEPAMSVAYQTWNSNSRYNFKDYYEPLRIAVNEVEYLKKGSGSNIAGPIDNLAAQLDTIEATTTDIKDYTDYQMYRLNRFNDARDDANYYINLKNDASNGNVTEIDESFPYTWIEEDDLRALVAGNTTLAAYTGGTDKGTTTNSNNFITALLEPLSDEEVASKTEWLKNRKAEYAAVSDLDVEMASVYLELTGNRLLPRADEVVTKYLEDELTSAINMIGDFEESDEAYAEISGTYSERSWVRYEAAYLEAWEVLEDPTQKTVFDAKYELMCARNELVPAEEEADYSELEALMAQAEYALAHESLYDNTAKELGQVLAELGIDEEIAFNGGTIDLFPGSAYYVNAEPYSVDDQDIVDQKASELKEALARLKFKGLEIKDADGNKNTSTGILVEGNDEEGIEEVTATIATIAKEMDAKAVKDLFKVEATNAGTVDVTVSNDLHYTVDTDLDGFAGTNSVVTFYTTSNGVKIPVATVRIVVNGDINGDGAVDVLDGAYAQLVSTNKAELEGCYLLAGDLSGNDRKVEAADYGAVVNLIVA